MSDLWKWKLNVAGLPLVFKEKQKVQISFNVKYTDYCKLATHFFNVNGESNVRTSPVLHRPSHGGPEDESPGPPTVRDETDYCAPKSFCLHRPLPGVTEQGRNTPS